MTPDEAPPLDTDVAIETPEHIVFRHRVAGPARRSLAYLVDLLVCYGTVFILAIIVILAAAGAGGFGGAVEETMGLGLGFLLVVLFAAQWVYFAAWEAIKGRTPGKMAAGLRVVTKTGRPISVTAAILRNLLRAADALPFGYVVGVVTMTISPRFQRLGDLVAGTMVIVVPRVGHGGVARIWPPPRPDEIAVLPNEVLLDAEERSALELFLRRKGTLGPAREDELANMIVEPLARRFGFRLPDATRTLALLYDRALNEGRGEAPPSSRSPQSWR